MKKRNLIFIFSILCFLGTLKSYASQHSVININDDGPGSLRYAVDNAVSGDTILFSPTIHNSKIILSGGSITLSKDIVILGPGQDKLSISGNAQWPVLFIDPEVNAYISGVTITEGHVEGFNNLIGGAIDTQGNLTLKHVKISQNYAGGIYNTGTLNLINVTISDNSVRWGYHKGGAGALTNTGTAYITDSEISRNQSSGLWLDAGTGGIANTGTMSIYNSSINHNSSNGDYSSSTGGIGNAGTMSIYNCTISHNSSGSRGGSPAGLANYYILTIENSTIAYNSASSMDGHANSGFYSSGTLTIKNTIIAQNGPEYIYTYSEIYEEYWRLYNIDGTITGTVNDLGHNFIGVIDGINLTAPTNLYGFATKPINPLLGPLQNNGGYTTTHALLEGSRCINKGKYTSSATYDQRGYLRTRPDIGAYEYISEPVITITNPLSGASFSAPADITVEAELSDEKAYLLVTSVPGYRKLKLGYDSLHIYHAIKNVIAGGNDKLEITLRDFDGNTDWTKIQVRPNGSTVNPVSLAPYISLAGDVTEKFVTITIPLSDFDSSIDFSNLNVLELPYSTNAGPFKIGIQKVAFTGGTTPFLWFGDSKIENAFDGGAVGGQLYASLIPATSQGYISKVEFYNGSVKIGEDATAPYSIDFENVNPGAYQLTAVAKTIYGTSIHSQPVDITVNYPARASVETALSTNDVLIFPNPVTDKVTIKAEVPNAKITITDVNGLVQFEKEYNTISEYQADLSYLSSGIYFIKIENQEEQYQKVIKLVKR